MKFPGLILTVALLSLHAQADVCSVARQGRMSLTLLENLGRNVYDEFTCGERSSAPATGAAASACNDLHSYSCGQEVVRDPLSAAYPEEARLSDFAARFRGDVLPELGAKLQELETQAPRFAGSVATFIAQGAQRADVEACLFEEFIKESPILPHTASPACLEIRQRAGWEELRFSTVGYALERWLRERLSAMIVASRKHQTLKQVIFPQAKALMLRLMDSQSAANPAMSASYLVMKRALERMYLVEPRSSVVNDPAQMNTLIMSGGINCNHTAVVKGNFADIAHGIIHEMAHHIDPCGGAVPIKAGGKPEFPLRELLSCLQTETGLDMGTESSTEGFTCENAAESFADLIATALLPHLLPVIYGDALKTPDDYAQVYAGIGRSFEGFCTPMTDGRHPTWNARINMLVASNPVMRSQMGCSQLSTPGSSCFRFLTPPCP
jgi:hypothetical protein